MISASAHGTPSWARLVQIGVSPFLPFPCYRNSGLRVMVPKSTIETDLPVTLYSPPFYLSLPTPATVHPGAQRLTWPRGMRP